jgi:hypothetical protein
MANPFDNGSDDDVLRSENAVRTQQRRESSQQVA